jgi:hypothetical protein
MPAAMSRTLEIWLPMWKCSSFSAVAHAGIAQFDFHRVSNWRGIRPNLALSPPVFCHLPAPSDTRRMRTPSSGCTPRRALLRSPAAARRLLDDDEDICRPSLRPISARRMYSRSL